MRVKIRLAVLLLGALGLAGVPNCALAQQPATEIKLEVFSLKHAPAPQLLTIVRQLFAAEPQQAEPQVPQSETAKSKAGKSKPAAGGELLRISADDRTNMLMVRGTLAQLEQIRGLVTKLDIPSAQVPSASKILALEEKLEKLEREVAYLRSVGVNSGSRFSSAPPRSASRTSSPPGRSSSPSPGRGSQPIPIRSGSQSQLTPTNVDRIVKALMMRYDKNGDNRLSKPEFNGAPSVVQRADKNKDGVVTVAELTNALTPTPTP